jgi:hypothetical protein
LRYVCWFGALQLKLSKDTKATLHHNEMVSTYHKYLYLSGKIKTGKKYKGKAKRLLARLIRVLDGGESSTADYIDKMPYMYIIKEIHEDFKTSLHVVFRLPDFNKRKLKKHKNKC